MDETPAPDEAPDGGTPAWAQPDPSRPETPPSQRGYAPAPAPTGLDSFFASIRRTGLVRTEERWIGGVSGGIAQRLGIDPLIVRGLLGVGALLGGVGLVLYGVGWLLMPEQRDGRIHLQQLFRGDFDAAVIGGFALLLMGFAYRGQWHFFGSNDGGRWFGNVVGLVAIAVIVALIISARGKGRPAGPTTSLRPGGPQYGPQYGPQHGPQYGPQRQPRYPTTAPVHPAPAYRPEGTSMYPAPPAPGQQAGPAPTSGPTDGPGYGPAYGPQPAAAPWPPTQPYRPTPPGVPTTSLPRTRANGPGGRSVGIVFALSLLLVAGLLYADRVDAFDGPVMLTAAAGVIMMCGLGIAVAGAMGRRSGGLGAIAIITILVAAPLSASPDFRFEGTNILIGDGVYTPITAADAEDGYDWGLGDVTVDLTELPDGSTITVPMHLGAGDIEVIVPEGAAVTAEVRLGAGDVTWLDDAKVSGVGNDRRTFASAAAENGATPDIELDISVGAGSVTVVERS